MKNESFFRKILFMCIVMLFASVTAMAQKTITGTLTDAGGEPLIGANVIVKGTSTGTVTDLDGKYSISASESDVLVFSYIGYEAKEIPVGSKTVIDVILSEGVQAIEELVVIGYGTVKKEDLTGSVAVVSSEDLNRTPSADMGRALQGRAPGVMVTQGGEPGSGVNIRVRGIGSITSDPDPLYVVDGVVGADINAVAPQDIETMQILKDASATAIYGSEGANGVVIITTKRGQKGETQVNFSAYTGFHLKPETFDLMNADLYSDFYEEVYDRLGEEYPTAYTDGFRQAYYGDGWQEGTDWQNEVMRPGNTQNYYLRLSSGSENSNFSFSTNYTTEKGIVYGSSSDNLNLRLNSDFNLGKYIKVGETVSIKRTKRFKTTGSPWGHTLIASPLMLPRATSDLERADGVSNEEVNKGFEGPRVNYVHGADTVLNTGLNDKHNPLPAIKLNDNINYHTSLLASVYMEVKPFDWLTYKITPSARGSYFRNRNWNPTYMAGTRTIDVATLEEEYRRSYNLSLENQITFDETFNDAHHITLTGVHHVREGLTTTIEGTKDNFPYESLDVLTMGLAIQNLNGEERPRARESYLGRLIYDYRGKYLLTASWRRDGSYIFGPQNKYGDFPSASFAWKLNEDLLPNIDEINSLKLRIGWGQTGFEDIGAFKYVTYVSQPWEFAPVLGENQTRVNALNELRDKGNPFLKWESAEMTNFGVDASLFNNKLQFTGEYYIKNQDDLLTQIAISRIHGVAESASPWVNIAEMRNEGFEFTASYRKMEGAFNYAVSANLTTVQNEVEYIPDPRIEGSNYTRTDYTVGSLYGYVAERILQEEDFDSEGNLLYAFQQAGTAPGDIKFKDLNKDGQITAEGDRTIIGNPIPKYNYSINLELYYRDFDFSMFLFGMGGYDVLNLQRRDMVAFEGQDLDHNKLTEFANNYWTPENRSNEYIRPDRTNSNDNYRVSSWWVEDASFLRLKDVQFGYTLPPNVLDALDISKLRLYVSALNLYTFTNYKGRDPEAPINTNDPLEPGVDNGEYPIPRTITFGVQLDF